MKNQPLVLPETSPAPRFSFVWVDDLARIIHRCIQNGSVVTKSFNIAGPERISYADLIAVLEKICDRTLKTIRMPIVDIVRRNIPLPFPPDINLLYDGIAIGKLLDGAYTPFERGMAETWQHYIKVHSGWN